MIGYLLTKVANFQPPLLVLGLLVKVISDEHLKGLLVNVIPEHLKGLLVEVIYL